MALRQRRTVEQQPDEPAPVSAVVETIKRLDVYPKTLDDFKERTGSGAVVSLVSCAFIFLLVVSELRAYLTTTTVDHLYVDTTRGERIRVNLNITFPNMPCAGMRCLLPRPAPTRPAVPPPLPRRVCCAAQSSGDGRGGRAADRRGE